jgi:hypothetical protein
LCTVKFQDKVYKLDGHTRAHLWSKGALTPPEMVTCIEYAVQTLGDFENLYYMMDNPVLTCTCNTGRAKLASPVSVS